MFTTQYDSTKAENAIGFLNNWSNIIADLIAFFKEFWAKISGLLTKEEE